MNGWARRIASNIPLSIRLKAGLDPSQASVHDLNLWSSRGDVPELPQDGDLEPLLGGARAEGADSIWDSPVVRSIV